MREIKLTKGRVALVSDEDYERVAAFKWCASCEGRTRTKWYAIRRQKTDDGRWIRVSMHRFIMGLAAGDSRVVDHRDGDGLNNCRPNLDVVTQAENMARAPGWQKPRIGGMISEIDF